MRLFTTYRWSIPMSLSRQKNRYATAAALAGLMACASASSGAGAAPNLERNPYFGETHVHTSWSLDAFVGFGLTSGGPEDFYRYATGETVQHPGGFPVTITEPLDWAADTEHSEYLGAAQSALDPNAPLSKTLIGHAIKFLSLIHI